MKNLYVLTFDETASGFAVMDILSMIERQCDYICNGIGVPLLVIFIGETKLDCERIRDLILTKEKWKAIILKK